MSTHDFPTLAASAHAARTSQPLTTLMDKMKKSSSNKLAIKLSIGDPTVDGNLVAPQVMTDALLEVVKAGKFNGYPPVSGYDESRDVVSQYWQRFCTTHARKAELKRSGTLLTSGGSHAIVLAITAIANAGDNILVPRPGFPHYKTVCEAYGIECRYYPLQGDKRWEADLAATEKLKDDRTKAMVMVNPSNPCGSNFSRAHVEATIKSCERMKIPLLSDEIYGELVFGPGEAFTSVADFDTPVPRVIIAGSAKHGVTPGWRMGWVIMIDSAKVAADYLKGMDSLAQLHTGSNSVGQMALARSLLHTPESHLVHCRGVLAQGAKCYDRLAARKDLGITFDPPVATMFVMLQVDISRYKDISSDYDFYAMLLDEENVQLLPGEIFGVEGCLRATISRPAQIIDEAIDRIIAFAERHIT